MVIKKIKIKDYKQFKDTEIRLHKGLNVIVGAHGTGKTNLCELLKVKLHLLLDCPFAKMSKQRIADMLKQLKEHKQATTIIFLTPDELKRAGLKADYILKDDGKIEAVDKR